MELNHTDDASTQSQKLVHATNEIVLLTNQLIEIGTLLNQTEVNVLMAFGAEDKRKAKILRQQAKGKYKEVQARIKAQKEIINSLKVTIRAENLISGGF